MIALRCGDRRGEGKPGSDPQPSWHLGFGTHSGTLADAVGRERRERMRLPDVILEDSPP